MNNSILLLKWSSREGPETLEFRELDHGGGEHSANAEARDIVRQLVADSQGSSVKLLSAVVVQGTVLF